MLFSICGCDQVEVPSNVKVSLAGASTNQYISSDATNVVVGSAGSVKLTAARVWLRKLVV